MEAAIAAQRGRTLAELVRRYPGLSRRILRRYRGWVSVAAYGDAAGLDSLIQWATAVLHWAVSQLRPDRAPGLNDIPRDAWLDLAAWRPMLTVACQAGLLQVPDIRERYRRGQGESAVDNLCGLWGVGSSTFYRHLERGKERLVEILDEWPPSVPRRLALRRVAQELHLSRIGPLDERARIDWHIRQAAARRLSGDPLSALWHALQAADVQLFLTVLHGHALELAGDSETDALLERFSARSLTQRQRVDLLLARAALHRNRQAADRELKVLEEALRLAQQHEDPLQLGVVHGALGKFHESRDGDRAFACYETSVNFFREAGADRADGDAADAADTSAYVTTLVRLAWQYVLRNDPRARAVLDAADAQVRERKVGADVQGMLEQTAGEYWRRAGELDRAIAAKHRALLIFERLGDRRSMLVTHLNLISLYWEAKDYERAIDAARPIQAAAATGPVEPAILASTHINLGVAYFWKGDEERAVSEYEVALDVALRANLRLQANRAHYNLAELFYKRFAAGGDPAHEHRADAHIAAMLGAPSSEITPAMVDAARRLKGEVLGTGESSGDENRLLPMEAAIHTEVMTEIGRHRSLLALPVPPEEHARARLAIVAAYQAIAQAEYRAAVAHLEAHGLQERFGADLVRLRSDSAHDGNDSARALSRSWMDRAQDLLNEAKRNAVIARLLRDGAINKSGFAELCGVSPATASKHLVALAGRGLLQQTGKGPSTRYVLPD